LPGRLGVMRPEDVPPPDDPLTDAALVARWRGRVRGTGRQPVVALCWRGNPDFSNDAVRSPGLAPLLPLLDLDGLRFVSLQVGTGREEIGSLGVGTRLDDIGGEIEAAGSDVLDTMAVLANCDYVISCCTSVIHMAGVGGRSGQVLLAHRPDWRWMTGRSDSPWYPGLELLRQPSPGDWNAVIATSVERLRQWRDSHPQRLALS
jgi:hypothetical protein